MIVSHKTVRIGRSRPLAELAHPTWTPPDAPRGLLPAPPARRALPAHPASSPRPALPSRPRVQLIAAAPVPPKKIRVAGYCRTSTRLESQASSIASQREHYGNLIQSNAAWELVEVYWETGVSGTKADARPELQRLLADCKAGRVDMVVTKSISRFARNTTDCLRLVRMLAGMGVVLRFDKENIQTDRMESELLLTALSALAQDEVRSISGNIRWAIKKRFEAGTYWPAKVPYGYRKHNRQMVVHPAEARVVRRIFYALLEGKGAHTIARELNAQGVPTWTQTGEDARGSAAGKATAHKVAAHKATAHKAAWRDTTIRDIVRNPFYTGDSLHQRAYRDDDYTWHKNTGQLPQYLSRCSHPAIVDHDTFKKASFVIALHNREGGGPKGAAKRKNRYCFSGRLVCGACGATMYRGGAAHTFYLCRNHSHADCPMPPAYEKDVQNAFATLLNRLAFAETHTRMLRNYAVMSCRAQTRRAEERAKQKRDRLKELGRQQDLLHNQAIAEGYTAELREQMAVLNVEERVLAEQYSASLREPLLHSAAQGLCNAVISRGILPDFGTADQKIFAEHVRHAVVWSRRRVEFHFVCGLVLVESIAAPQPDSPAPGCKQPK